MPEVRWNPGMSEMRWDPGKPMVRWEAETGEFPAAWEPASLAYATTK